MENLRRHEVRELARLTSHLTAAQQTFFQAEYGRHRRNPTTALVLCLLLGGFGAHYFYFGRHRGGILRLLLCWTLVPEVVSLFEARTMTARALRYNASLANELVLALNGAVEETTGQVSSLVDAAPAALLAAAPPALAAAALAAAPSQPVEPLAATPSSAPQEPTAPAPAADVVAAGVAAPADDAAQSAPALLGSTEPAPVLYAVAATPSDVVVAAALPAPSPSADALDDATDAESRLIAAAWAGREPSADDPSDPPLTNGELAAGPSLPLWHTTPPPVDDQFSHRVPFAPEMQPDAPASVSPSTAWPSSLPDPEWHEATEGAFFDDVPGETPWQRAAAAAAPSEMPWPFADSEPAIPSQALAAAAWQSHDADPFLDEGADPSRTSMPSGPFRDDLDTPASAPVPVAWDRHRDPLSDLAPDAHDPASEPVFMYQVAPQPRRAAVRLGPPPEALFLTADSATTDIPAWSTAPTEAARLSAAPAYPSRGSSNSSELAALGSALAAGLADLLRERPARPGTRPLTRPLPETTVPLPSTPPAHDEPLPIVTPIAEPTPALAAPPHSSADYQQPDDGIREPTAVAPAAAYVATPSRNLRRRVVQRVIVRKMAVLDGQVVAESTVERQVPVVADEARMSARIHEATTDAAREALQNLMAQAPEHALPAIRMQMDALDSASSVQSLRGADDHGQQQ